MTINIRKYNPQLLSRPGILYCGRGKTKNLMEIGLGNPFSHQSNSHAPFFVKTRKESIICYKKWLYKLLKSHWSNTVDSLLDWERTYLERVLKLAEDIATGRVTDLVCFCLEYLDYKHKRGMKAVCHVQILYAFCLVVQRRDRLF